MIWVQVREFSFYWLNLTKVAIFEYPWKPIDRLDISCCVPIDYLWYGIVWVFYEVIIWKGLTMFITSFNFSFFVSDYIRWYPQDVWREWFFTEWWLLLKLELQCQCLHAHVPTGGPWTQCVFPHHWRVPSAYQGRCMPLIRMSLTSLMNGWKGEDEREREREIVHTEHWIYRIDLKRKWCVQRWYMILRLN